MYTYEAVKAALFRTPTGVPALNREPTRRCHSREEKKGLYRHHNQFICPTDMDNLDYIRTIEVCQDESLQTYLNTLGGGGKQYTINTTTYWENMRRRDLEKRDRLKFLWQQSWDQHIINAVGVLNYHPPMFTEFLKNYLLEQNKLWIDYGVEWQLHRNLAQRNQELQQELRRVRQEREDLEEQVRGKKCRRVYNRGNHSDNETSDTEGETETEEGTDSEEE